MIDLAQFQKTYFEECSELLSETEERLLALTGEVDETEELHAVFRAVHSIKGGAGAFGFDQLVHYAHTFETLLDAMRDGRVAITREAVSVLIRAKDVLAHLVAAAESGQPLAPDFGDEVARELKALTDGVDADDIPAPAAATTLEPRADPAPSGPRRFRIDFKPHVAMLRNANEPLLLFREMASLGRLEVTLDDSGLPDLDSYEPSDSYLAWRLDLWTKESEERIGEVFEFVEDDCDLTITSVSENHDPDTASALEADPIMPEPVAPQAGPAESPTESAPPQASQTPARGSATGAPVAGGGRSASIRVDLEKVDRMVNQVGEIVITQAMLAQQVSQLPVELYPALIQGVEELNQHTRELQESVMAIRAQPVKSVFARMVRLVHDTAPTLGKEVRLVLSGENTEVDKTVVEQLSDPLTHMIRNAIDHGIERPDMRERAGKPRHGTIHLSAGQRAGRIVIEINDDGAGINRARVLEKAIERGLVDANSSPTDEQIDQLIFAPGFSTAAEVSDISGRGVGMDVVRRNIQDLGGRVLVQSTPGQGTRMIMSLPLTLAVLDGMVVAVGEETYVLPLTNIIESLRPAPDHVHGLVNTSQMLSIRGEYVPLVYLHDLFGITAAITDPCEGLVVLVDVDGGERIGLVIDEMLGQQQVVIKTLETNYRPVEGVSGATILGSGKVALILDVSALSGMWRSGRKGGTPPSIGQNPAPASLPGPRASTVSHDRDEPNQDGKGLH